MIKCKVRNFPSRPSTSLGQMPHASFLLLQRHLSNGRKSQVKAETGFFFHFSDPPFNFNTLTSRIVTSELFQFTDKLERSRNFEFLLIDAIKSCKTLHLSTNTDDQIKSSKSQASHEIKLALAQSRQFSSPLHLLTVVLDQNELALAYDPLHIYLATRPYPPTTHVISLLKKFKNTLVARSGGTTFNGIHQFHNLIYIALRRAILRRELNLAYELVDLSSSISSSNPWYKCALTDKHALLSATSLACMTGGSILTAAYFFTFPPLVAIGALAVLSFSQCVLYIRGISRTSRVRWRPGISISLWARLTQQHDLQMINRLAIGHDELIDLTVDNYHHLANSSLFNGINNLQEFQQRQLARKKMRLIETEQERMFNEYWTRAGEGFVWAEPDQDPSDRIIRLIRQKDLSS